MNIITIDPSLSCTAMVINDKKFIFVNDNIALTKTKKLTKWFELAAPLVTYSFLKYDNLTDYSSNEIFKLKAYDEITNNIIDTIHTEIIPKFDIQVHIEGYSFSSAAGPLIDLVTFSTLLRKKLYDITENIEILSPSSLKLEAAKLTYPPISKGKKIIKYEYRNNDGIAGGSFTKREMFKALIENPKLTNHWVSFLRDHSIDILNYKNIPKPLEDINDAQLMYFIAINE